MTNILSGGIPAISLFEDIERFIRHSRLDVTGFDYSNPNKTTEQVRKDAQPIKYLMKMFPGTKSLVTWFAAFQYWNSFVREFTVQITEAEIDEYQEYEETKLHILQSSSKNKIVNRLVGIGSEQWMY